MGLRKAIAPAVLALGLLLIGGAAAIGLSDMSQGDLERSKSEPTRDGEPAEKVDPTRVEAAWRNWMARHNITQSSLAIGHDGAILHSAAQIRSPETAYPMASLSKAITGMCFNQLLTDRPYTWDSTISDLMPEFRKMNFSPAGAMADLTLAQIATHTSGLPEVLTYGTTSLRAQNLSSQPTMTRAALGEPSNFGSPGQYVYSNSNYAILGFLIEAITGEPYADYCAAKVMAPAGVTEAAVTGRMAYTAGYGGWSVSTEDYARFAMHWFDPEQPWMKAPQTFAYDNAARYGMGTSVFRNRAGTYVSHYGRWTHTNPQHPNIGAMFFVRADGATVVVNWNSSLDFSLYDELHNALREAL